MALGIGSYGLGLLAGLLSTLSPCVLPILPLVLGSAAAAHRHAPLALAAGLALSYAIVGAALAWAAGSLGLDTTVFRDAGAALLGLLGLALMSGALQQRFASLTAGIGNAGSSLLNRLPLDGLKGQFAVGLALGVVWSPCVGPTLGAAILLASQGANMAQAGLTMAMFGVGAALPLVALAYLSRGAIARMRPGLAHAGKAGKVVLGAIMVVLAALILTGAEKSLETWLVDRSPDWLTQLTTRF